MIVDRMAIWMLVTKALMTSGSWSTDLPPSMFGAQYHFVVKCVQYTFSFWSLNEKMTRTTIGRYRKMNMMIDQAPSPMSLKRMMRSQTEKWTLARRDGSRRGGRRLRGSRHRLGHQNSSVPTDLT